MNILAELETQDIELESLLDFAVIGAGIAGLTAASEINELGYKVAVFEKARGTGGRMSSKRVPSDNGKFMAFDLGCVSITAENSAFSKQLEAWHLNGVIAPWWEDNGQTHYVPVPRNSALTRYLSKNLECHFGTKVIGIEQVDGIWHLFTEDMEDELKESKTLLARAKNVIIATPPAQAKNLLPAVSSFKDTLDSVEVFPQWVMAVEVDNSLLALPNIQYPDNDIIFSISYESNKPSRNHNENNYGGSTTVLQVQATENWTSNHLQLSPEQISTRLVHELEGHFEQSLNLLNHYAHRWLYSCVAEELIAGDGYLWDDNGLGLVGDYIISARENCSGVHCKGVESAWLSGMQLAKWIGLDGLG